MVTIAFILILSGLVTGTVTFGFMVRNTSFGFEDFTGTIRNHLIGMICLAVSGLVVTIGGVLVIWQIVERLLGAV